MLKILRLLRRCRIHGITVFLENFESVHVNESRRLKIQSFDDLGHILLYTIVVNRALRNLDVV